MSKVLNLLNFLFGKHDFSAVFAVMVQSVLSTLIDAFAIGWIIAKISRPKKRAEVCHFCQGSFTIIIFRHFFSREMQL